MGNEVGHFPNSGTRPSVRRSEMETFVSVFVPSRTVAEKRPPANFQNLHRATFDCTQTMRDRRADDLVGVVQRVMMRRINETAHDSEHLG